MATSFSGRNSINNRGVGVTTSANANKFLNIQPQQPYIVSSASGGTITEVVNYNGTGQVHRVHRFNSNGTFTIGKSNQPFRYLLVGAGSDAGNANSAGGWTGWGMPGAPGGRVLDAQNQFLAPGSYTASVATVSGQQTLFGSLSSSAGLAGGAGSNGVSSCGNNTPASPGAAGPTSNITGTLTNYGGGGGGGGGSCGNPVGAAGAGGAGGGGSGGWNGGPGAPGTANTGGGGGGRSGESFSPVSSFGGRGGSGTVIISYRHAYVTNTGF